MLPAGPRRPTNLRRSAPSTPVSKCRCRGRPAPARRRPACRCLADPSPPRSSPPRSPAPQMPSTPPRWPSSRAASHTSVCTSARAGAPCCCCNAAAAESSGRASACADSPRRRGHPGPRSRSRLSAGRRPRTRPARIVPDPAWTLARSPRCSTQTGPPPAREAGSGPPVARVCSRLSQPLARPFRLPTSAPLGLARLDPAAPGGLLGLAGRPFGLSARLVGLALSVLHGVGGAATGQADQNAAEHGQAPQLLHRGGRLAMPMRVVSGHASHATPSHALPSGPSSAPRETRTPTDHTVHKALNLEDGVFVVSVASK